uniref:Uncharacterized protein n=1 Tax=Anopheles maculatus TaxID=74869 RepID=A0A182SHE7_9DIPT
NGNNNLPTSVSYGSIDTNGDGGRKEEQGGQRAARGVDDVTSGEGGNSGNQNAYSNAKLAGDASRGEAGGRGETKDCDSSKGGAASEATRHQQQQQMPRHNVGSRTKADPSEISYSVPTSPTTYGSGSGSGGGGSGGGGDHLLSAGNAGHDQQHRNNNEMSINSMPTSPEYAGVGGHHHHQMFRYGAGTAADGSGGGAGGETSSGELTANTNMSSGSGPNSGGGGMIRKCDAAGFRTSRSEDHLQQTQRDGGIGAVVSIDIDEDVNSSLNTLLDTRHDSQEYAVSATNVINY